MSGDARSPYSAAEQGLGYIYQARFALLKILELPEDTSLLLEKEDDIDFDDASGHKSLMSLKHKAVGDTVTDLATDFWKSVRIWLMHYKANGTIGCDTRFMLFTTATVSTESVLTKFIDGDADGEARAEAVQMPLAKSKSVLVSAIRDELATLTTVELNDFYSRITIIDAELRITEIPSVIINQYMRTIRRESRTFLFERLEGWWMDQAIRLLAGERTVPIAGVEVSDKLSSMAEEYRNDNLPITFRQRRPDEIDIANDPRMFVEQLRALDLSTTRLQNAIIDYYRAFEQRSSWARENLLVSNEIEEYEDRLIDEWTRYKEVIFEAITDKNDDTACLAAGRELYRWAELETTALRIRERVTEPYVVRGTFHILANARPQPHVHWHPRFLEQLARILGRAA
jgi:hypothetical protein